MGEEHINQIAESTWMFTMKKNSGPPCAAYFYKTGLLVNLLIGLLVVRNINVQSACVIAN